MKNQKKVPIQIYLEPEQDKILSLISKAMDKSKAAIIRDCISKLIDSIPPENDPALNVMNLGASGKTDIAANHDDYLASLKNK